MAPEQRPAFATYLLPTFTYPFRRRRQSSSASASTADSSYSLSPSSSANTTPASSPPNLNFLPLSSLTKGKGKSLISQALQNIPETPPTKLARTQPNTLKCSTCATDIAFAEQIVSKGFTGRHGRAYLVGPPPKSVLISTKSTKTATDLINIKIGRNVNRELLTGHHVVADVTCAVCATVLGWKYVDAKEASQRYKIGKFILEMKRVVAGVHWEDLEEGGERNTSENEVDEEDPDEVVFDSEDEDDCDDLFAGVWDAETVAKRKGRKVGRKKID